jgi:hypothetical protein
MTRVPGRRPRSTPWSPVPLPAPSPPSGHRRRRGYLGPDEPAVSGLSGVTAGFLLARTVLESGISVPPWTSCAGSAPSQGPMVRRSSRSLELTSDQTGTVSSRRRCGGRRTTQPRGSATARARWTMCIGAISAAGRRPRTQAALLNGSIGHSETTPHRHPRARRERSLVRSRCHRRARWQMP